MNVSKRAGRGGLGRTYSFVFERSDGSTFDRRLWGLDPQDAEAAARSWASKNGVRIARA